MGQVLHLWYVRPDPLDFRVEVLRCSNKIGMVRIRNIQIKELADHKISLTQPVTARFLCTFIILYQLIYALKYSQLE